MRISKDVMQLSVLNRAYATLQEMLAKDKFTYKSWLDLADLFEQNGISTKANRIRKEAARIQKERSNGEQ